MARLLGHNFLRSNFVANRDPVRVTANAKQQNRVANVLKYISGLGCRVVKPVGGDGKNWLIVVDGNSDVTPPPNYSPPWSTAAMMTYAPSSPVAWDVGGYIQFDAVATETNDKVLECVTAPEAPVVDNHIMIHRAGLYTVRAHVTMRAPFYVVSGTQAAAILGIAVSSLDSASSYGGDDLDLELDGHGGSPNSILTSLHTDYVSNIAAGVGIRVYASGYAGVTLTSASLIVSA